MHIWRSLEIDVFNYYFTNGDAVNVRLPAQTNQNNNKNIYS